MGLHAMKSQERLIIAHADIIALQYIIAVAVLRY
jgi:hypothetical protein